MAYGRWQQLAASHGARMTISVRTPQRLANRLLARSLRPIDLALKLVGLRYSSIRWMFTHVPPSMLANLGRLRAERAAVHAQERVPAYRAYLASVMARPSTFSALPETD